MHNKRLVNYGFKCCLQATSNRGRCKATWSENLTDLGCFCNLCILPPVFKKLHVKDFAIGFGINFSRND